ncbi:MAG: FAD-binding protein, partial [Lachnospiraceae bacterium]|nr:FAD-binding protein [Lachnospiraceae bacterium]
EGYDVTKEWIPVVPAQHYFMGGVHVDRYSHTSMRHLYAAGETCCNGVHGRNRLASNSLLESLVFAKNAALRMSEMDTDHSGARTPRFADTIDLPLEELQKVYRIVARIDNLEDFAEENKQLIWDEIHRLDAE